MRKPTKKISKAALQAISQARKCQAEHVFEMVCREVRVAFEVYYGALSTKEVCQLESSSSLICSSLKNCEILRTNFQPKALSSNIPASQKGGLFIL